MTTPTTAIASIISQASITNPFCRYAVFAAIVMRHVWGRVLHVRGDFELLSPLREQITDSCKKGLHSCIHIGDVMRVAVLRRKIAADMGCAGLQI